MRGKVLGIGFGKFVLLIFIIGIMAISSLITYKLSVGRTIRPPSNSPIPSSYQQPNPQDLPGTGVGKNIEIAYPTSTNVCADGCKPHQNWIEFYLPTGSYIVESLKLRTSLFMAQVLTLGISSTPCDNQPKAGYTCLEMQLSHNLLTALTGMNLTPLKQLRNPDNWWLEYEPER
jgi:hypothetical protein